MNDDYLWDGSGKPDPEVQKLEEALGRYRQNQPAPKFDEIAQTHKAKRPRNLFNWRWEFRLDAVAASLLLAVTVLLFMRHRLRGNPGPSWDVVSLEGAPRVGRHSLDEKSGQGKLGI